MLAAPPRADDVTVAHLEAGLHSPTELRAAVSRLSLQIQRLTVASLELDRLGRYPDADALWSIQEACRARRAIFTTRLDQFGGAI